MKTFPYEFNHLDCPFDKLCKMQHYGAATRILDFTIQPEIALWFASDPKNCTDGKVIIYRTTFTKQNDIGVKALSFLATYNGNIDKNFYSELRNDLGINYSDEYLRRLIQKSYFVLPNITNERLHRQDGLFLIFGQKEDGEKNISELDDNFGRGEDLSRLGREYLEVGKLTELVFPSYGVRFIAINDNVDSFYGENDFVPFKNLFNEFYAKDTSRKIRAVKKAQAQRGERLATRPRYGYRKADGDPKKIVRDPQAADIVQKIFLLCASGKGPSQIARLLKREQILNPSNYYFKKYGVALTGLDTTRPFEWSETTVAKILEDEIYLGHTISLRYTTQSYKNKRRIERPETEWLRFEDTHEPLITKELWELVREVRRHKRRAPKKFEEPNLFSGLLYCADCGAPLRLHRTRTQTAHFYNNFKCSTYSNRGKDACSGHYIRESQLKAIVLDDLRRVTQFARQKENLLLRHVARQNSAQAKKEISLLQGELDKLRRREQELTALFKRLYEDNVLGRIPDEQYRILSAEYTQERTLLQEKIPQMAEQQEKLRDSIANAARFVERARQYSTITELTPELLRLFIDKIVIGERSVKYSRCAAQEVSIYYRDVGLLDTAEELDMENLLSDTAASA